MQMTLSHDIISVAWSRPCDTQQSPSLEQKKADFPQQKSKNTAGKSLGDALTHVGGEDVLVVDLHLDPVHEQAHVLGGRQSCGLLVLVLVLPAVFILGPARHDGAGLVGARVADSAVNEVDAVEEVDHVDGHPVVEVLSVGQLYRLLQVQPGVQRGLGLLVQLETLRPGLKLALGPECPVFVEDLFQGIGHGCMR